MAARLEIAREGTPDDRVAALVESLIERLRATPGVESVARTAIPPMSGYGDGRQHPRRARRGHGRRGHLPPPRRPRLLPHRGRAARRRDGTSTTATVSARQRVAIVNRTFATTPAEDLLAASGGSSTSRSRRRSGCPYEVVGLAEDAVYRDVREPVPPVAYLALGQDEEVPRDATLMIHSTLPPAVLKAVRAARRQPGRSDDRRRVLLALAEPARRHAARPPVGRALGGVRRPGAGALGDWHLRRAVVPGRPAPPGDWRQARARARRARASSGWWPAARWPGLPPGSAAGGVLAVVAATAARSMLFGLAPTNPLALVAAAVALGAAGAAATIIPAMRAARLPPTSALREN